MPHIVDTVRTAWTPEIAFAYMADFSNAPEWDPSVVEASRQDAGAIVVGSVFHLVVRVGNRRLPLRYEVTDCVPGRVTFTARSSTLESIDTVTVEARGSITEVTYDAQIRFRHLLRIGDPLLALVFRRIADRAMRGLEQRMAEAA